MRQDPPAITPGFDSINNIVGRWYVVHTRSRFEKALAKDLISLNISYYLPMKLKTYVSSGKKRRFMLPVFTSYIFVCLQNPDTDKEKIYRTNRATAVMNVADQERFIAELNAIETALDHNICLDLLDSLPKGSKCRVITGALLGIEGVVIESIAGKSKIALEVYVLGKSVVMEIDSSMVELIH